MADAPGGNGRSPRTPSRAAAAGASPKAPKAPKAAKAPAPKPPSHGMAVASVVSLVAAVGVLTLALPVGFRLGGAALGVEVQGALVLGALAAGAWGAFSAREDRVLAGFVATAALLAPAWDPAAPLARMPLHLAAAVLFLLAVQFALLHAKIARLAAMPRAHVTYAGKAREVELQATAARIAGAWPGGLALALGLVALMMVLQAGLAAVAPPVVGQSVELQGPFGLALAGVVVLGASGLVAARRGAFRSRSEAAPPAAAGTGRAGDASGPLPPAAPPR